MKKTSKFLSVIMAVLMVLAVIPMTAFAATPEVKLNEVTTAQVPGNNWAEFIFTPEESGTYAVYSDNGGEWEIDPLIYIYDSNDVEVGYNDDSNYAYTYNFYCDFEAEAGEDYYLYLGGYGDYDIEYDFCIIKYFEISHQPTEDEPYVEITPETDVDFQWYLTEQGDNIEITDKQYLIPGELDNVSEYDESTGWIPAVEPAYYDETKNYCWFFDIILEEGDVITVETDGLVDRHLSLYNYYGDYNIQHEGTGVEDDTYTFIVDETNTFGLWGYACEGFTAKVYINGTVYSEVDGGTDAELTPSETGEYCCMVTDKGGRSEFSHFVEITDLTPYCTCKCHDTGIAGFFFKIVLFFQKIFGINVYCWCGAAH